MGATARYPCWRARRVRHQRLGWVEPVGPVRGSTHARAGDTVRYWATEFDYDAAVVSIRLAPADARKERMGWQRRRPVIAERGKSVCMRMHAHIRIDACMRMHAFSLHVYVRARARAFLCVRVRVCVECVHARVCACTVCACVL